MQNDLISRSALLDVGSARKIIEVIGNWDELSLKAKSACTRLGVAHKKMIMEAPAVDAVSRSVFEQIKWERDCAMQQLKDHGIPFGGIAPTVDAVRCEECMFRSQYANEEGLYKCGAITCKEGHCAMVAPHFSCSAGKKRGKDDGTSQA